MKTPEDWPVEGWDDDKGKRFYRVEDDEGYNFSFDSMDEAIAYRRLSSVYTRVMKQKLPKMVKRFEEEVLS